VNKEEILALIVERMRATFEVRRIILFGSQACGNASAESDYDVLVEVDSDQRWQDRQLAGLRALRQRKFPIDLLVLTPEEVQSQTAILGSAVDWALTEGRVLYAR